MTSTKILKPTALATANFTNKAGVPYVYIYYQTEDNAIRESLHDYYRGWHATEKPVVTKNAKLGTPITARAWKDGTEIHIFYLDASNRIHECIKKTTTSGSWTDSWTDSVISLADTLHTDTKLSVAQFSNNDTASCLFYQKNSTHIAVIEYDGSVWETTGEDIVEAEPGSSFAVGSTPGQQDLLWLYFQDRSKQVRERRYQKGLWGPGGIKFADVFDSGATISAVLWDDASLQIRVYVSDKNQNVTLMAHRGAGNWRKHDQILPQQPMAKSAVAALKGPETMWDARVFYQIGSGLHVFGAQIATGSYIFESVGDKLPAIGAGVPVKYKDVPIGIPMAL